MGKRRAIQPSNALKMNHINLAQIDSSSNVPGNDFVIPCACCFRKTQSGNVSSEQYAAIAIAIAIAFALRTIGRSKSRMFLHR